MKAIVELFHYNSRVNILQKLFAACISSILCSVYLTEQQNLIADVTFPSFSPV